jgi:hypothetical protein
MKEKNAAFRTTGMAGAPVRSCTAKPARARQRGQVADRRIWLGSLPAGGRRVRGCLVFVVECGMGSMPYYMPYRMYGLKKKLGVHCVLRARKLRLFLLSNF